MYRNKEFNSFVIILNCKAHMNSFLNRGVMNGHSKTFEFFHGSRSFVNLAASIFSQTSFCFSIFSRLRKTGSPLIH